MLHQLSWGNGARSTSSPSVKRSVATGGEETFESVAGQNYSALKYLSLQNDSFNIFVEAAWTRKADAEILHSNDFAVERSEN